MQSYAMSLLHWFTKTRILTIKVRIIRVSAMKKSQTARFRKIEFGLYRK